MPQKRRPETPEGKAGTFRNAVKRGLLGTRVHEISTYRWRSQCRVRIATPLLHEAITDITALDKAPAVQSRRNALATSINKHMPFRIPLLSGAIQGTLGTPKPGSDEEKTQEKPALQA